MANFRVITGRPAIDDVGMQFGEFKTSRIGRVPWAEILRLARKDRAIGEVRAPSDWSNVPTNRALRAVYLVDNSGPVIRWLVPGSEAAEVLGGNFHEHLENGDGHGSARSGWIKKHSDGKLEVF